MSGHSKWSTIKHKKALTDSKKANVFSRLSRDVMLSARGGSDPETNFKLRLAIEKARAANMPFANIEKAIQKGSGQLKEGEEEFIYEAYGPGQVALLIKVNTDNKNRTLMELKSLLKENKGKLVEKGSISWQFEPIGLITLDQGEKKKEDLEMIFIESGAKDFREIGNGKYLIYTYPKDLQKVGDFFDKEPLKIEELELGYLANNQINLNEADKADYQKLSYNLKQNPAVISLYDNLYQK